MPNLNKIMIIGTLTRDPEMKYTPKGTSIAEIGLAVNRNWTTESGEKREEVTFIDITLWGRVAEIVGEYCHKGSPLFVEGRLQLDQWDDRETGKKRSKLKVIGENIQLLGQKPGGSAQGPDDTQKRRSEPPGRKATPPARDPDLDPPEDEAPF